MLVHNASLPCGQYVRHFNGRSDFGQANETVDRMEKAPFGRQSRRLNARGRLTIGQFRFLPQGTYKRARSFIENWLRETAFGPDSNGESNLQPTVAALPRRSC